MKIILRFFAAVLLLSVLGCAPQLTRNADKNAYTPLILISIDGYRADYLQRGLSPTLTALAADGVRAEALRPAFPSLTFPNHYTLVTGLNPDHHGIVNNRMINPVSGARFVYKEPATTADPNWWGGEPIWVSVEKNGQHAATMFWPGSDVAIKNTRPSYWRAFDGKITPDERVDQVLQWLDLPADQRPVFLTLYFDQVDHGGHDFGPDSAEVNAAIALVDTALQRLVQGLKQRGLDQRANLVIVSDHGMTSAGRDRVVVLNDLVNVDNITVESAGILAGLAPKPGHEKEVENALLKPQAHMQCWKKTNVPIRLHYGTNPRIPEILCLANEGWLIGTQDVIDDPKHHFSLGEHGYDNDLPSMRALFIAHGSAFKHGLVVPEFDNVDVYPMLMRVLGITAQPNDGNARTTTSMLRVANH
ncbi:alkaline phosphatase family protein [Pseudolysobacter antarcticus]|uniref:Alkaline phosphatase family protein n=1 Tax=Pseudolysobacter antarcticus TaxID=2511995 RepID=A0A411HKV7_9GAMM|nr:ectonucleotide pyrophosphatase/phosphodiesterase [Pseudolysobacter antarcticus]QBB71017.1 alkaline phosphatase family protein [Pseudolysobacter antarcticus]